MAKDTIATMAIRGSAFSIVAAGITMVSGFVRSVLLARLLLPEQFGVVTLALFFLSLTTQVQRFSLSKAFIQNQKDSPDHLATFATLRIGLTIVTVVISLIVSPILAQFYPQQPGLVPVLIALAALELVKAFNAIPEAVLSKALSFQRLAVLNVASSLTMTLVAPVTAWLGGGIWALVSEKATGILVSTAGLWLFHRPWQPDFNFNRQLMRGYLRFGGHLFVSENLNFLLDQFDDFWIGTFLGATALGFYSRAYEFARYPRRVLAGPLIKVFYPTFTKLQNDRQKLSKAFYRASNALIRIGFLIFGTFALAAPEFIDLFLGERWTPMALTFRLMLLYTLLDPLTSVIVNLLIAVGQPQVLAKIQAIRFLVFIPAVVLLGEKFGINGVAGAADIMLVIGMVLLFRYARNIVDFSIWRMFAAPIFALFCAYLAATGLRQLLPLNWSSWGTLIEKVTVAPIVYITLSFILERKDFIKVIHLGYQLISKKKST